MKLAGRLRHRVNIESPVDTQDATTGEIVRTWTALHSKVPARIEHLSVREFLQSKADQSEIAARITIRYRAGLTADMRILHGSTVYNPAGFLADNKSGQEYLTIPCSQGINEG